MAGFWYRAGTVSVTNASKKVVGSGTLFKTTTFKPDKGHAFYGPDGKPYEIDYVESDTVLYLVKAYAGATASGQSYEIDITRTSTIPALSREISAQLAYAQGQYDSWQQILTGSGNVTLAAPDGQSVTVPALSNMLSKSGPQVMSGILTNIAGRINIEGDRFVAFRMLNQYTAANLCQKFFEYADNGDLSIITRGLDGVNRGVITVPANTNGSVHTTDTLPTTSGTWAPYFDDPTLIIAHMSGVTPTWSRVGNVYSAFAHLSISGAGSLSGSRAALRGLPFHFGNQFRPVPMYESRLLSGTPGKSAPGGAMVIGSEIQFFYKDIDGSAVALTQEQLRPNANGNIELILNITIVV